MKLRVPANEHRVAELPLTVKGVICYGGYISFFPRCFLHCLVVFFCVFIFVPLLYIYLCCQRSRNTLWTPVAYTLLRGVFLFIGVQQNNRQGFLSIYFPIFMSLFFWEFNALYAKTRMMRKLRDQIQPPRRVKLVQAHIDTDRGREKDRHKKLL